MPQLVQFSPRFTSAFSVYTLLLFAKELKASVSPPTTTPSPPRPSALGQMARHIVCASRNKKEGGWDDGVAWRIPELLGREPALQPLTPC